MHSGHQDGPASLSTVTGAKILDLIANAIKPLPLVLMKEYIYDAGCEYVYSINLDTSELAVQGGYPEFSLRFKLAGLTTMRFLELAREAESNKSDGYNKEGDITEEEDENIDSDTDDDY